MKKILTSYFKILLFLFIAPLAYGQSVDLNFQGRIEDIARMDKILLLQDSSLLYAGDFTSTTISEENKPDSIIELRQPIRLDISGEFDSVFTANVGLGIQAGIVQDMIEQEDGKIIIAGTFREFNNVTVNNMVRLNPDGSIDQEFQNNLGTGFNANVSSVDIQEDGKILAVGPYNRFNDRDASSIVRLNPDGTIDETFATNVGTGFDGSPTKVKVLPNQYILVSGDFNVYNTVAVLNVIRLLPDGSLDANFTNNTFNSAQLTGVIIIEDFVVQSTGNILLSAETVFLDPGTFQIFILQNLFALDSMGNEDPNFLFFLSPFITNDLSLISSMTLLSDDRVVLGGLFEVFDFPFLYNSTLVTIEANGSLDDDFLRFESGSFLNSFFTNEVVAYPDGQYVLGSSGVTNGFPFNVLFLDTLLQFQNAYTLSNPGNINTILELPDERLLVGGSFQLVNGVSLPNLAMLSPEGALDTTFNVFLGGGPDGAVKDIALQEDGKILVVGSFISFNNQFRPGIIRLEANGQEDIAFANNLGTSAFSINQVELLSNQKIILGGDFSEFDGVTSGNIACLNTDGTVDTNFSSFATPGFTVFLNSNLAEVNALEVLPDDFIMVGGEFSEVDGFIRPGIARIFPEGFISRTFDMRGPDGRVDEIIRLQNGDLLVRGNFTSINAVDRSNLVILKSEGALVEDFDLDLEFSGVTVSTQIIGEEERILYDTRFNPLPQPIARVNFDGSLDRSFNPELTLDSRVDYIKVLQDNNILLSTNQPGNLIRLITPPPPETPVNLQLSSSTGRDVLLAWTLPNNLVDSLNFEVQRATIESPEQFSSLAITGLGQTQFQDNDVIPDQQYFYRVRAINQGNSSPFSNVASIKVSPLITAEAPTEALQLRLSPNPTQDVLELKGVSSSNSPWEFGIWDSRGKLIRRLSPPDNDSLQWDVSDLPEGIYILVITQNGQKNHFRWIKI